MKGLRSSALACLLSSACAVMSMDRVPSPRPPAGVRFACSDGVVYPITDVLLAGGWTVASVAIVKADFGEDGGGAAESTLEGMLWLTVPFAVLHAVSAAAGFRWSSQCRSALADQAATGPMPPPNPADPPPGHPPDPWAAPGP